MANISVTKFDTVVGDLIARISPGFRPLFVTLSYLGHPITTLLIGSLVVAYGIVEQQHLVSISGAFVWIALGVSTFLKRTVERSRPINEYVAHMRIPSFSFPSGHTTGSTVAFGLLAYYAYHLLSYPLNGVVPALLAVLIFLIGVSRIYLGAHYPTDVAGGWVLGAIFLSIIVFVMTPLS